MGRGPLSCTGCGQTGCSVHRRAVLGGGMEPLACVTCGRALDAHDRHVRFKFPDPVLAASEDQRGKAWQSDPDANRAVMMQVPEVGPFVRALLPVHLSGGYTLTFGLWLL